jgi:hypothetical protein
VGDESLLGCHHIWLAINFVLYDLRSYASVEVFDHLDTVDLSQYVNGKDQRLQCHDCLVGCPSYITLDLFGQGVGRRALHYSSNCTCDDHDHDD